jgi:hypothetical protein
VGLATFTQEIAGSNPAGGTSRSPAPAGVLRVWRPVWGFVSDRDGPASPSEPQIGGTPAGGGVGSANAPRDPQPRWSPCRPDEALGSKPRRSDARGDRSRPAQRRPPGRCERQRLSEASARAGAVGSAPGHPSWPLHSSGRSAVDDCLRAKQSRGVRKADGSYVTYEFGVSATPTVETSWKSRPRNVSGKCLQGPSRKTVREKSLVGGF